MQVCNHLKWACYLIKQQAFSLFFFWMNKNLGQPGRAGRACGWDRSSFFGQLFRPLGSPLCLPVFPFVCPPIRCPDLPVVIYQVHSS
ncbi:hypothetical protein AQUCO_00700671v1 [Aquilegia coerulea]|uniref:Uncharacterized protein n=1 Tax=Aquilegia coerulea TaxID=218851 RepID=A0A2G5ELA9_AQUCA|nr:hypothetical protein AQUCO_00700671v1 [Aquilegia coerulea]